MQLSGNRAITTNHSQAETKATKDHGDSWACARGFLGKKALDYLGVHIQWALDYHWIITYLGVQWLALGILAHLVRWWLGYIITSSGRYLDVFRFHYHSQKKVGITNDRLEKWRAHWKRAWFIHGLLQWSSIPVHPYLLLVCENDQVSDTDCYPTTDHPCFVGYGNDRPVFFRGRGWIYTPFTLSKDDVEFSQDSCLPAKNTAGACKDFRCQGFLLKHDVQNGLLHVYFRCKSATELCLCHHPQKVTQVFVTCKVSHEAWKSKPCTVHSFKNIGVAAGAHISEGSYVQYIDSFLDLMLGSSEETYCSLFRYPANQLRLEFDLPLLCRVSCMLGGWEWDFVHQQYHYPPWN